MPQGGARSRSGPPPDPDALRRDRPSDQAGWIHLPAAGRPGEPPAWPLAKPTTRERTLWAAEWLRPQALMWESLGLVLEVAMYVRNVVAAEKPDASPPMRTLVLRQMDSLGLTVGGLARNRWVIDDVAGAKPEPAREAPPARVSAKERLKLVVND
jgi:hypothetical protein